MEEEIKIVLVRAIKSGKGFVFTLPKEAAEILAIKGGEKVKVIADRERRAVIYQLMTS